MVKWIKSHNIQITLTMGIIFAIVGLLAILGGQPAGGALVFWAIIILGGLFLRQLLV